MAAQMLIWSMGNLGASCFLGYLHAFWVFTHMRCVCSTNRRIVYLLVYNKHRTFDRKSFFELMKIGCMWVFELGIFGGQDGGGLLRFIVDFFRRFGRYIGKIFGRTSSNCVRLINNINNNKFYNLINVLIIIKPLRLHT